VLFIARIVKGGNIMDFKIKFNMDNDAFIQDPVGEVSNILQGIANRVLFGDIFGKVLDHNGNTIGEWKFTD